MVIKRISGISEDDTSMADVSMADVSVDNGLNDSSMVMAMGPANTSMAGLSDMSGGEVQKVTAKESDGGSMYSGTADDVVVKRAGNEVS